MPQSQESLLLSLAPELTHVVTNELDIESVKQLRLTCKQLAESLNGQILRSLTIYISKDKIERGMSKLVALATSNHAACQATRELFIKSLSPAFDPSHVGPARVFEGGEDPPWVTLAEERMKDCLFKAIASLKGVQMVHWTPFRQDGEWAHIEVMEALKGLPNLREFRVHLTNCKTPLPIHLLTGLQKISVDGTCNIYDKDVSDNLAKAIAQTPQLTSIDVERDWYYDCPKTQSLHHLFKYYPRDAAPLLLRHLRLKMCLVRLDEVTLPHLTHLTSLELVNIKDPYVSSLNAYGDRTEEATTTRKRCGSSLEEIWKMLRSAGVHLEETTVDAVTASFIDYLSSYSGLKKLHITRGGFYDGRSSDEMAKQFFTQAFENHFQSLEDLSLVAQSEGLWCFGDHNSLVISKCINLIDLRIAIISSQLWKDDHHVKTAPNWDAVKLLLDTAVTNMPQIRNIHILAVNHEQPNGVWRCGTGSRRDLSRVSQKIAYSVNNYTAPSCCRRLPSLRVGSRSLDVITSFIGDLENQNAPLRYISNSPFEDMNVFDLFY